MARAIDADKLQELCNKRIQDTWNNGTAPVSWAQAYADFKDDIDSIPTLTQPNEPLTRGFDVIDTKTGEYPDLWNIALKEDWAKDLMYCDMEGFAIEEDGTLLLLDECGKFRYCPIGRFEVRRPPEGEEEI